VNREEQVKVVIRLKPESGESSKYSKCVYLSDKDEHQLVVETDHKREIFLFDHVAHETATQAEVYRHIGQECVQQSFEVLPKPLRATTAASSPTARQAQARPTPSSAASKI
jgi:hypothetical protein